MPPSAQPSSRDWHHSWKISSPVSELPAPWTVSSCYASESASGWSLAPHPSFFTPTSQPDNPSSSEYWPSGVLSWNGLLFSPVAFQHLINDVLKDMLSCWTFTYNGWQVYSCTLYEHVQHIRAVLQRLLTHQLFCKLEKCAFHQCSHIPGPCYLSPWCGHGPLRSWNLCATDL